MKSPHFLTVVAAFLLAGSAHAADPLRVGVFDIDATPPEGSPLAYDPLEGVTTPLRCRGVVLAGAGKPVVLCSVDWIGIGSDGQTVFREALAEAAGTRPNRVAVHAGHQHDAPRCDFSAEELLAEHGLGGTAFDPEHARSVAENAADAVETALAEAKPVTHLGLGAGVVEKVASNRRILGDDGTVKHVRWTATKDPKVRAFPVGTIDPELKMITLWNGDETLVALTYYATHPQSYYRTGLASVDFPGLARNERQEATGVPHVHFNGAGGNIGAGKWNDGSKDNRPVLADRVAAGMKRAWKDTEKRPLEAEDVGWEVEPVSLPPAEHLDEEQLEKTLANRVESPSKRYSAAKSLAWLRRCRAGDTIPLSCLALGEARVLHLPGELFVEYQLAAQEMRPDLFVAMAAYGDYAPGYIGTEVAYGQGGYETSERASRVAPEVEGVLMGAMRKLLDASQ